MVTGPIQKDLRLVLHAPKCARMNDACAITLKFRPIGVARLGILSPAESPDFSANGASTARSLVSISSRDLQNAVRRGVPASEECFVTIDSQTYLSILAFQISNPICQRKLAGKNRSRP